MKSTRRIKTSPSRFRCNRDYSRTFEQSRGRRLSRADKAVIYPLERARLHGIPGRFLIVDRTAHDSRPILLEYLRWLRGGTGSVMFIHNRTRWYRRNGKDPRIKIFSWCSPNAVRGHTFNRALFINSEAAFAGHFTDAYRAVIAVLDFSGNSLLVIHAKDTPPANVPGAIIEPDPPPRLDLHPIDDPPDTLSVLEVNSNPPPSPPGNRPTKAEKPHRRPKR